MTAKRPPAFALAGIAPKAVKLFFQFLTEGVKKMLRSLSNICLSLALLSCFTLAHAVPLGAVMTDFGGYDLATATAVQADGKIVVAGEAGNSTGADAALARYLPDGRLDASFGTGGKAIFDLAGCPCNEEIHAMLIQPDGKIVVGGSAVPGAAGTGTHFALARFNANGTVDTAFGVNGKVFINLGGYYEYAYALTLQSDGKIVAAGDSDGDFALTRVSRSGRLDTGFGVGGKVRTDFDGGTDEAHGVVIQADGKIVAGGFAGIATGSAFAMTRYTSSGALDTTFGSSGKVTGDNIVTVIGALSMAQQSDGKLILAGSASPNNIALLRFLSNGAPDSSFGSSGKVTSVEGAAKSVVVQPDGKVVVGGYTRAAGFSVLRFDSVGLADNSFGVGGVVTTDINPPDYFSGLYNLAVTGDNKIVAVGIVQHSSLTHADFGVVRYDSNGALDSAFGVRADLVVSMSDSPDPILAGDNLTYTITVSNAGSDAAQAVEIGGIPINTTLVSATSSLGACTGAVCKIGTLAGGTSATVTLVVSPYLNGTLTHSVTVNSTTADGNSANNSATTSTVVNGNADLVVSMIDSPDPVKVGQNLTYTVTIQNVGTGVANQVVLTDMLPSSYYASYVSSTTSQGSCSVLPDSPYYGVSSLRCALGQINAGASATVAIVVNPIVSTFALQNAAEVKSLGDRNPANNTASAETMVGTFADLGVTVRSNSSSATTGQNVTYIMEVSNDGPDATNARAMLNLPPSSKLVSATPTQGSCTTVNWNYTERGAECIIAGLASGGKVTVTVVAAFGMPGSLSVSADVSSNNNSVDSVYSNNSASASIAVTGQADLAIAVTGSPQSAHIGTPVRYTMTVTNLGPDASGNVVIRDILPLAASWIEIDFNGSTGCDGYVSAIGGINCTYLRSGSVWTIAYTVTYSATGSGQAQFIVNGAVTDPNSSNNSTSVTTTVSGNADLVLSMTAPATVAINKTVTYSIQLTNQGPDTAIWGVLSGSAPSGFSLVSATTSQGDCYTYYGPLQCYFRDIPSGAAITVTVVAQPLTRGVMISHTVTANSNVADSSPDNNTASSSTFVK